MTDRLRSIVEKAAALRPLTPPAESEVVVDMTPPEWPLPPLPGGITEVFSEVHRLGGNILRFERPSVFESPAQWEHRHRAEGDALADTVVIGSERFALPEFIEYAQWSDAVRVDLSSGAVFHCSGDDHAFYYENPEVEPELDWIADSVFEFFDEWVLGARYPDLVRTVVGEEHQLVLGHPETLPDHWLGLLRNAGVA